MLRSRKILALVVVLASPSLGMAQTAPFVANHLVSNPIWAGPETAFDWMDLPGSEQTLVDVPAGTVLITWSSTLWPDMETRMRPRVDASFPADGTIVRGAQSSGSWLTTTTGGTFTVALQVKNVHEGCCVGQFSGIDSLSWSVLVFPETSNAVPAIGMLGTFVMIALLLGVGAVVMKRRVAVG